MRVRSSPDHGYHMLLHRCIYILVATLSVKLRKDTCFERVVPQSIGSTRTRYSPSSGWNHFIHVCISTFKYFSIWASEFGIKIKNNQTVMYSNVTCLWQNSDDVSSHHESFQLDLGARPAGLSSPPAKCHHDCLLFGGRQITTGQEGGEKAVFIWGTNVWNTISEEVEVCCFFAPPCQ